MSDLARRGASLSQGSSPVRSALASGLPTLLREGLFPLATFYLVWRWWGLAAGIVASVCVSAVIFLAERRAGRDALMLRIALASVVLEAAVGLLSGSTRAYLATGALENAVWAAAFIGSAAIGRPLAGVFARATYPFPPGFQRSDLFLRVFGVISVVWGLYLAARCAVQLWIVVHGSVGGFVIVSFVTGKPTMIGLFAWSIWFATRRLDVADPAGSGDPSATNSTSSAGAAPPRSAR